MIFIDISGCFKILGLTTHPKTPSKPMMVGEFKRSQTWSANQPIEAAGCCLGEGTHLHGGLSDNRGVDGLKVCFFSPKGGCSKKSILETFLTHKRQKNH